MSVLENCILRVSACIEEDFFLECEFSEELSLACKAPDICTMGLIVLESCILSESVLKNCVLSASVAGVVSSTCVCWMGCSFSVQGGGGVVHWWGGGGVYCEEQFPS